MTVIDRPVQTRSFPTAVRPDDTRFVGLAADIGAVAAAHAAEHDRDATFVAEAYDAMRERGYLALSVPDELGGLGATMRQVCYAQAELARHDGATALASAMHQYLTLMQGFRRRKGAPDAEGVLRRVAAEGIVIATSGGSDWLWPTTTAVAVEGGFRVSGRKTFCSQSPAATVVATCAVLGEEVLHFSVPLAADGVRIEETWDTLGMRGTASHDVVLEDVFVPSDKIAGRRPYGEFGVPLMAAAIHFAPVVAATYYGIAAGARDVAVHAASPQASRQVGLMDAHLREAWWSLLGAIEELGDDYGAEPAVLATVMTAKRHVVTAAIAVVDLAMDLVGGRSYFRRSPLERAYRDVRAGKFHPLTPETTLTYVGKLTLGDPGVTQ
ncbi:acyl-CoA dehydrogenase family protein [Actinokineospora xionganensis]|uniref:Acyl-CoA/acyl-ACP dehydrogenase n=1 Tax=Actinokineospora xionganensis TaxID=2684470 RepID=A0ABR7L6Q9_9PSEU|nr:acyl-CoA dehydrogenase family protein [Actinokineospora xionganensis]MBC6448056.1 acyl-CoA/acyl-ACP dehydrogenase [Actinokineospora xionganensis]